MKSYFASDALLSTFDHTGSNNASDMGTIRLSIDRYASKV